LPLPLVHFGAVAVKDQIIVVGGQDEKDSLHPEIYRARMVGGQISAWEPCGSLPVGSSRFTVDAVADQVIMTGGGFG